MNSRWQASRIGLINFWYYDDQEFPFVKGRMLLRGSNGSGKSVTMQSVIPLLLDGNMSPERLDPFGSRDRKMSSYLLEEDDGRDERTGYLYLEFKRKESDTWLTVGMGIRARRGKPLDKWYFSLSDGRRVGKDFLLYKEIGEKVTLSKKELENRIAGGGQVFDRQADYMEYVNRQIFGFETVEEYKELIDLLIQLRTPKLSKDFKPSVVNDILSDSLQPLSDEDLRPMSEAIENMDTMNLNLKAREAGYQAAEKIQRVLDRYNRLTLFEKADRCCENQKKLSEAEREAKAQADETERSRKRVHALEQEISELDARRDAMEKERESLSKSDAVSLKSRELDLASRIRTRESLLEEKQRQLDAKQEQYTEIEGKKKQEEDRAYEKERELDSILEEMRSEAEEMSFEEHDFFQAELKENFDKAFSWETHETQFRKVKDEISRGMELLREAETRQREADDLLKKRERQQRETDAAQRREGELESVLVQVENEWKEALYSWNGRNEELKFTPEQMREMARFADEYGEASDFARVRQTVADLWIGRKSEISGEVRRRQDELRDLENAHREIEEELAQWESSREPEPPRSDAVRKNRERLREKGIPYQEFYKVVEFGQELSGDPKRCGRLEEALLEMGILDALVIEEQYRDQVMEADPGCADRYLFVQPHYAEKSLLDVLDLNDSVNDIFMNQRITGILGNIALSERPEEAEGAGSGGSAGIGVSMTAVHPDGSYQIGVVSGTISGEHEAGFIGVQAREKNRQAKIASCRGLLAENEQRQEALRGEVNALEQRISRLQEEYENLPEDTDMREAWKMLSEARRAVERMREEGARLERELMEVGEALGELKRQAAEIAQKLYLTCSYETFRRADEAASDYRQHFYQLRSGHELFLQIRAHMEELGERQEILDGEMDQIRYEAGSAGRELKKEQEEYESILRQLELTDYEQIRQKLDECMEWLKEYPERLQSCVAEKTQNEERIRALSGQAAQNEERIGELKRRAEYLETCFEAERSLHYVELQGEESETAEAAEKIRSLLAGECRDMDKEQIIRSLNQVYFENRGFLTDYQIMQTELFEEMDQEAQKGDPSAKRLDIAARYQGVRIPFGRLLTHLAEEIEELKDLIKAGDRELFEDILANTVSRKIRGKINSSNAWVEKMNSLMGAMNTSSGLKLNLRWRSRTAETEDQLDTKELVELLKKDYRLMREDEAAKLSAHFRSKVEEARRHARDSGGMISFYQVMKETLDYRKWFEFQLFFQKGGERVKELTNSVFGTFSGGEKAMAMYVPLFSAVVAKYQGGRPDAPRLISLDEAFAGVDNRNIRDMFRLMAEFQFDFIINSQVLWGDCDTLDALAIYQLLRPENAKFVTVMPYLWNGHARVMLEDESEMEKRAAQEA
ncbi:TIGR02680 family protein [Mediterraneibacter glycyrrhizinilyticus]|uniref:TIGR02680 family protein n=1 Tax=Mediterraneibacter glycyrrhizinilyticus TaxID=342942 RepID=UPI001961CF09|nr:TIGR02680 family protein [Mediterraneibacter glycyrrhizinilyticus]MBM6752175.1 TIGR02680 family protein [Mediterraneibacter glycyrrhizinilyticus]